MDVRLPNKKEPTFLLSENVWHPPSENYDDQVSWFRPRWTDPHTSLDSHDELYTETEVAS